MSKRPIFSDISSHSSLTLWLIENRAEFAASLRAAGKPSWKRIAVAMADLGLRDGNGRKPSPDAVYVAWKRVQARASAKPAHVPHAAPKPAHASPAPAQSPSSQAEAAAMRERLRKQTEARSIR